VCTSPPFQSAAAGAPWHLGSSYCRALPSDSCLKASGRATILRRVRRPLLARRRAKRRPLPAAFMCRARNLTDDAGSLL